MASLKRKKLLSTTPLKLALNSFIFALKDSAAASQSQPASAKLQNVFKELALWIRKV